MFVCIYGRLFGRPVNQSFHGGAAVVDTLIGPRFSRPSLDTHGTGSAFPSVLPRLCLFLLSGFCKSDGHALTVTI